MIRALLTAALLFPIAANAAELIGTGTFSGQSGHVSSGTVTIVDEGNRHVVVLGEDFRFDGGPDAKVALGRDGYDADTLLAPLASNNGAQSYEIPASIDPADYNQVWIWCEQYSVPLALAPLR